MSNSEVNIFEVAVRNKFRFPIRGNATVEDLWDLSLRDLDQVFKSLNNELKQVEEESLLDTRSASDKELVLKVEIVKHIVTVKLEENEARLEASKRREQKARIKEILADKQDESLKNMSTEELTAMLNDM